MCISTGNAQCAKMNKRFWQWDVYKVERKGKCDYKKCNALCCRMLIQNLDPTHSDSIKFYHGFGKITKKVMVGGETKRILVIDKPCKFLDLTTNKCKRYKTRPQTCRDFPKPYDGCYVFCKDVCGYSFKRSK